MEICWFQENWSLSISPEDLILYFFYKIFLSGLKITKKFVLFLRMSSEYLTRYGQGSVFKICFQGSVEITCLYFFEYSPDFLKEKTKTLDIFNTDKKCFIKINIESSPPEIWIRIRPFSWNQRISITAHNTYLCCKNRHHNILSYKFTKKETSLKKHIFGNILHQL